MDFKTEKEKRLYIIENATYFTIIRFRNRKYERQEAETLAEAELRAKRMLEAEPDARFMIYAVSGDRDTWVCTIQKEP